RRIGRHPTAHHATDLLRANAVRQQRPPLFGRCRLGQQLFPRDRTRSAVHRCSTLTSLLPAPRPRFLKSSRLDYPLCLQRLRSEERLSTSQLLQRRRARLAWELPTSARFGPSRALVSLRQLFWAHRPAVFRLRRVEILL